MATQSTVIDYLRYRGQWLALDPATESILDHNPSLIAVEEEARLQGVDPVLEYVPESATYVAGTG